MMIASVEELGKKNTLAFYSDGLCKRLNNCDFLRFFAAWLVVFTHTFVIVDGSEIMKGDPLKILTHGRLVTGEIGLFIFFVLGGFLIASSYFRIQNAMLFMKNRCLRILPGFFCIMLLTAFVLGPLLSTLPAWEYFSNLHTYHYLMNLTLLKWVDQLPGVFENNPAQGFINGSLWTIRAEFYCYFSVCVLAWLNLLNKRGIALVFGLTSLLHVACTSNVLPLDLTSGAGFVIKRFAGLYFHFSLGLFFYLFRDSILCGWRQVVLATFIILLPIWLPDVPEPLLAFAGAYLVFYFAFVPVLQMPYFGKHGDLSYGIYLYAWPIQQIIVQCLGAEATFGRVFWLSVPAITLAALASWHLLEKKALQYKFAR
jgi:peptidoglycan/LPS O-acetylase OafA/YrhL